MSSDIHNHQLDPANASILERTMMGQQTAQISHNSAPSSLSPVFLWFASEHFARTQQMLSWLLNGPLSLVFVLSGIALNALCVLVFLRFRNTGGTTPIIHYYLISLAGWHSALLCNAFMLYCLPTLLWGSVVSSGPYVHLYPPTYTLANATHTGTVWIILALTLDRYLALCMPFKHRIFSKRSRVKRLVVGLSLLALLFCLPRFFEVRTVVECVTVPLVGGGASTVTNATTTTVTVATSCETFVQRTGLPENQLYRTVYHILLGSAFVTILPGVLTFVLTLRITIALGEARRRRKRLSHCQRAFAGSGSAKGAERESQTAVPMPENFGADKQQHRTVLLAGVPKKPSLKRKEHRANVMLVVVIVKFLISDILPTVLDVFETFIGNEVFMASPIATLWVDFSNFLLVINCSTNFWVFLFYTRGFRQRCVRLIINSLLRCSASSPLHDEASGYGGSCVASPRPSTPYFSVLVAGGRSRSSGGAGEHSDLAKGAILNSAAHQNGNCTTGAAPASPTRSKRASSLAISFQQPNGRSIAVPMAANGAHHPRTLSPMSNGCSPSQYRMFAVPPRKKSSLGGW